MEIKIDKENPTNGDVIKAVFPNSSKGCVYTDYKEVIALTYSAVKDWWNAPYEGVISNGES